ncbi:42603_t:CDS:2 [Gigaspora margarita]|uniref:42603_t:CDS:1 n=1 Tax=Gigaspora margarita TaxID=4874 RepID=A0ABN7UL64_GIGMA|nr:42603_t:CDS:2 [Gigaspora margarita]
MEDTNYDESYSDSDSEFVTKIENLPILNFDIDTYQDFDEEIEEILLDQSITNNKYTPCVIVDNDNNERRIQQCNRIDEGGSNQPLAQLKGTWEVDHRCEQLWTLSNQIYAAFQNPNPNSHLLFEYTTQNTSKGYSNIETCYQHEIECMQDLLAQEVYLTKKKNTKGRASKNLVKDTVANFKQ